MSVHGITLTLPDNIVNGDLLAASGAVVQASTMFVDWDGLHNKEPDAIGPAGRVLLDLARQLSDYGDRVYLEREYVVCHPSGNRYPATLDAAHRFTVAHGGKVKTRLISKWEEVKP